MTKNVWNTAAKCVHGIALGAFLFVIGCGGGDAPPTASVEGTVTLDGQPAANIEVMFVPAEGGRPATAVTDAEGHYELTYSSDTDGAMIGEHKVSFQPHAESEGELQEKLEDFPVRYLESGVETATVTDGSNTIDFELQSGE